MNTTLTTSGRKPVTGHIITPSVIGNKRMTIIVNADDLRAFTDAGYGGDGTVVTDLITGAEFTLARADCGAGCMCATRVIA